MLIAPNTGQYVESFSFDNTNFYDVKYTKATISNLDFALSATYEASTVSNVFGIDFSYILPNYFSENGAINLYLVMTDTPYDKLREASGSVDGVNVTATYGGIVSMVGDDFESLADDDTVTFVAAVCVGGYKFSHWENAAGDNLGTEDSIRLVKSVVMDNIIKAVFVPIAANSDYNGDKNN